MTADLSLTKSQEEKLKELVITAPERNTDVNHTRRLLDLEGLRTWERIKLDLLDAGFYWYITGERLNSFEYFAIVRGRPYRETNYIGDIPDFAIGRAELAMSLGVEGITLHSMHQLPITRVNTDPVMVGWLWIPNGDHFGKFTDSQGEKREGVVISVWDMDKEIKL